MNIINKEAPERQDIEALLPWHAAGTLGRRDAERVEEALASDRELARQFDLVREELNETIHLNESLGAPSARAMEKLFAAIDAEAPVARKASFDLAGRIAAFLQVFSPRTLAWSATAAAVAILVQAAVLTTVVVKDQGGEYGLAGVETSDSALAAIRFIPQASVSDITKLLDVHKAMVVDGPRKGGFFIIRLPVSKADLPKVIQQMKSESRVVEFAAEKH